MKLNVSRGQQLNFAANGVPASGVIVGSEQTFGTCASIALETDSNISDGAQLSIPDLPDIGGCGLAKPIKSGRGVRVVLSIPYSNIYIPTLGK